MINITSIREIEFHNVKANILFLLCLADINQLKIYFNNIQNIFVMKYENKTIPIIRHFGHLFLLSKRVLQFYVLQSFEKNSYYLTKTELCQLYRQSGHPSRLRLRLLQEQFGHRHDLDKTVLNSLIKYCSFCQNHGKSLGQFKFTLREDISFNFKIIVNIMYIDNHLILYVVEKALRLQIAKWVQNITTKNT